MKVKSDFVTNSSSTAYVMHIPQSFIIPPEVMRTILKADDLASNYMDESELTEAALEQYIFEIAYQVVEDLKNGEKIYSDDENNEHYGLRHNIAWTIMNAFDLEIDSIDLGGGSGMDVIIPVAGNAIEKITKKGFEKLEEKIKELNITTLGKTP